MVAYIKPEKHEVQNHIRNHATTIKHIKPMILAESPIVLVQLTSLFHKIVKATDLSPKTWLKRGSWHRRFGILCLGGRGEAYLE